jgi:hypothetical protein
MVVGGTCCARKQDYIFGRSVLIGVQNIVVNCRGTNEVTEGMHRAPLCVALLARRAIATCVII